MIILTLRTDKPEAEIGLYDDQTQLTYIKWEAHRQLAETLHNRIDDMLKQQSKKLTDVQAILVFRGPGSFTGLRIGLSVANALAYGLGVPIVGSEADDWIASGIKRLVTGESDKVALPEYGAPVQITQQKK